MSSNQNTIFIENVQYEFDQFLEVGNYAECKETIDFLKRYGFGTEADTLNKILLDTPITNFLIKSPYA